MMHLRRIVPIAWAIFFLSFISVSVFAQGKNADAKARHFGIGQPKSTSELPYGKLRKDLESLPAKARGKALGWLRDIEFPAEDVASIRVNEDGDVHYADYFSLSNVGEIGSTSEVSSTENALIDAGSVFRLHSRPGSSNVAYLDFDGFVLEGTGWSHDTLVALPFDPSGNDNPPTEANFTQDEINRIFEIWHRISEDYAAFDIDITTEEPAVFTTTTARLLFTHDTDANGLRMPSQGAGGTAFINAFGHDSFAWRYSPALVYYTNLSTNNYGVPALLAEAASHELGHNMGLTHDGTTSGANYYTGHGNGNVSWAPIMGLPYNKNVTQWSAGEYPLANNSQDDLATIANKIGFVGDDHGDSKTTATEIVVESNGEILVSDPQVDPDNVLDQNKGVINDRDDVDWFYVDLGSTGTISLDVTPAWHAFTVNDGRGSNLDLEVTLMNESLTVVAASDPNDDTNAVVSESLPAGRYFVQIDGIGNDVHSQYSDYASMGMFFIEGFVEGAGEPPTPIDTTPPSPSAMAWDVAPHAQGPTSIGMTAVLATDPSGPVEYFFNCVTGGTGCTVSGWQTSREYTLNGLAPETYYAFTVKARDAAGNETGASAISGITTPTEPVKSVNTAPIARATYSPEPPAITKGRSVAVTLDGTKSSDADGSITDWSWIDASGDSVGNTPILTMNIKEGRHRFTLIITDDQGATDSVTLEFEVTKSSSNKGKPPKK